MKNTFIYFTFGVLSMIFFSCGHSHNHEHGHHHGHANEHMNETSFEELVNRFESKERDEYQKPAEVIAYLGDVKDKVIMEIGAGTGYFSFRLAEAGAEVIAADVDERFQTYIKEKKEKLGISDERLRLRLIPYDSPKLAKEEVDMALIVNTYHHIENRSDYFAKAKAGLKDGGELVIIDFFKKESPIGPPVKMKIAAEQVKTELQKAGFTDFVVNEDLLPYQYILRAR